jgi:hypothetical protein
MRRICVKLVVIKLRNVVNPLIDILDAIRLLVLVEVV